MKTPGFKDMSNHDRQKIREALKHGTSSVNSKTEEIANNIIYVDERKRLLPYIQKRIDEVKIIPEQKDLRWDLEYIRDLLTRKITLIGEIQLLEKTTEKTEDETARQDLKKKRDEANQIERELRAQMSQFKKLYRKEHILLMKEKKAQGNNTTN